MPPKPKNATRKRILIIGGDSRLGAALCEALRVRGALVTATTRRAGKLGIGTSFLDLQDINSIDALDITGYDIAYVCAGLSTFAACEESEEGEAARRVNVDHTLRLCERLRAAGCALVFPSTSAVFDGQQPQAAEDAPTSPTTDYGRQKAIVESALLSVNLGRRPTASVVRLSKVLTPDAGIIVNWRDQLARECDIHPFSDLWLSPISLRYAVQGLIALGLASEGGVFHLSGERDVSYADCASALAARWGQPARRVNPHTIAEAGISLPYRPAHPTLGMARTQGLTGLAPQAFADCMDEVAR